MIKGTSKRGDKVRISTRDQDGRTLVSLSVIYAKGGGFADMAGSIEEAKAKLETALGSIMWDKGDE